jgi:hypothetical protein
MAALVQMMMASNLGGRIGWAAVRRRLAPRALPSHPVPWLNTTLRSRLTASL